MTSQPGPSVAPAPGEQRRSRRSGDTEPSGRSRRSRRSLNWTAGLVFVGIVVVLAAVSLVWLPYSPSDLSIDRLAGPSLDHLLGTDKLGRDLLTRVMLGARIVLMVGALSVVIGAIVGITLGLVASAASGWLDDTFASLLDILIAFPALLLAMILVAATNASMTTVIIAIGLAMSGLVARLTRILAKSVLSSDYVLAARMSGASTVRVMLDHVLANIWPMLVVNLALQFGRAAITEATLSFLGLGAPPPNPSWGTLLQQAQSTATSNPMMAIAPGVLLVLFVIGVNLCSDGIRDRAERESERDA